MKRIDWHRVFEDFAYLGMTGDALADRIGLRASMLQGLATGKQTATPGARNRIASLWCELTGKPAEFLPTTCAPEDAISAEVEGIDSNEEAPPSYLELQAITMVWAQVLRDA